MTTIHNTQSTLLRNALRANSAFSAISGIITAIGAGVLVQFMGVGTLALYIIIGLALVFHAVTLLMNTRTDNINVGFAWYAIIGDILWVLATAFILLTDSFSLSTDGKWLLLFIADIVLLFAIAQFIGLRRMQK
ncbi:MAG: hypothetical protein Phog2KO_28550 [Phototrophicaceae bacterium]